MVRSLLTSAGCVMGGALMSWAFVGAAPSPTALPAAPQEATPLAFMQEDADQATATEDKPTQRKPRLRVKKPFSELSDLSDEQKARIIEVRTEIYHKIKALEDEERERIMEILTPEQREQIIQMEQARKNATKSKTQKAAEEAEAAD